MACLKVALVIDSNNPNVGDLYLGPDSNVALTSTLSDEVAQLLYTRFRFFKGEWFLDSSLGVPYYQSILGIKAPLSIVTRILRSVVETCPGVASVDVFNVVALPGRAARAVFSCKLSDGTTLTSDDFPPFIIGG